MRENFVTSLGEKTCLATFGNFSKRIWHLWSQATWQPWLKITITSEAAHRPNFPGCVTFAIQCLLSVLFLFNNMPLFGKGMGKEEERIFEKKFLLVSVNVAILYKLFS